jgi:hypothetical protein
MGHSLTRSFLALMLVAAAPLMAQTRGGGSGGTQGLSERVQITYQQRYVETSSGRSDWMRFIVLWRGQPGWQYSRGVSAEERRQSEQAFREASAAATLAGRSLMGGSSGRAAYWAEVDRDENTIYLLGAAYHVPVKDSTLVILVDRVDRVGGEAFVVGSAVIDGHLPSDLAPKTWTSGDTTFTVRPPTSKTGLEVFLEALKKDPAVAAFIQ